MSTKLARARFDDGSVMYGFYSTVVDTFGGELFDLDAGTEAWALNPDRNSDEFAAWQDRLTRSHEYAALGNMVRNSREQSDAPVGVVAVLGEQGQVVNFHPEPVTLEVVGFGAEYELKTFGVRKLGLIVGATSQEQDRRQREQADEAASNARFYAELAKKNARSGRLQTMLLWIGLLLGASCIITSDLSRRELWLPVSIGACGFVVAAWMLLRRKRR
ncbi:hypothetical protein [Burkholderia cenocepacia]|uniref:hypothetical protein n=1 Tax=Burkholderia cenocepacia TaxID=95486 RepID=UPI002ABD20B6|nr:hypothetical protein [Burkholderia cenocepacia]